MGEKAAHISFIIIKVTNTQIPGNVWVGIYSYWQFVTHAVQLPKIYLAIWTAQNGLRNSFLSKVTDTQGEKKDIKLKSYKYLVCLCTHVHILESRVEK